MLGIIAIIVIVVVIHKFNQKNEEILSLKTKLRKLQEQNKTLKEYIRRFIGEHSEEEIRAHIASSMGNVEVSKEIVETQKAEKTNGIPEVKEIKKEKVVNKEDSKNTLILTAGAVFIILAAIVFLISTWNIIPNIVKTIVLVVFIEVFLMLSKMAKDKFNLVNASNTFFYIAMAYIPICLYSISFFKLFGEFLSYSGEGKYLYFTLANIVIAIIYMYQYKKNKSLVLVYGSILMQYLAVIFFGLIVQAKYEMVMLALCLYNILVYIFAENFEIKEVLDLIYRVVTIALVIMFIPILEMENLLALLVTIAMAVNVLLLEIREPKMVYAIVFNILLGLSGIRGVVLLNFENFKLAESLSLIYFTSCLIIQGALLINKKEENLKFSNFIVNIVLIAIIQIESAELDYFIHSNLILVIAICGLFTKNKYIHKVANVLIPIEFIITYIGIGNKFDLNYHYYMIAAIVSFILGECIRNNNLKELNKSCFIINHINLVFTMIGLLITERTFDSDFIYWILITEIYGYSYLKNRKENVYFKYIDYMFTNFSLISICIAFKLEDTILYLAPMIASCIIIFIEEQFKNKKELKLVDNFSEIYIALNSFFAYVFICEANKDAIYVAGILYTLMLLYRYFRNNEKHLYNIVPIIGSFAIIDMIDAESLQILLYALFIGVYGFLSLGKNSVSLFSLAGYASIICLDNFIYTEILTKVIVFVYTFVHMVYMKEGKSKDFYKVIVMITSYIIYQDLLEIIKLDDVMLFELLGVITLMTCISRGVVKKYVKEINGIEYFIIGITYFVFMMEAQEIGEAFSILFVELLFMFYSYYKKYGSLFIINIAMLIVGALYLTRNFWIAVPWWLYLLGIGAVLISVAVRNEAKEVKEKITIGKFIESLIDKIEK